MNQKILESLSPNERKVLPHIKENLKTIIEKSGLDETSVVRALTYLENKKVIKLETQKKKIVEIGVNGALYLKKGLPERRLLEAINKKHASSIPDAKKESKLSEDEFKAALGTLKKKAMIEIKKGKIFSNTPKEEIAKKTLEEKFIEALPVDVDSLSPEKKFALKELKERKGIIELKEKKIITTHVTKEGEALLKQKNIQQDLIEQVTPQVLRRDNLWKSKKFRRYDVTSNVPKVYGGKRHFVNQSIDYARKIWTEMGFEEMTGNLVISSLWNFDALFQPQDHPTREMHDTFFIDKKSTLPSNELINKIKEAHEKGVGGSKGWGYKWNEETAKMSILRTHTTAVSAETLSKIKKDELPRKFFAIGKNFRNETIDWSHGFEFNMTEGIVIDRNVHFRHLLGYLKEFFKKMGYDKIRFTPAYFPYTSPSVEIHNWNEEKKVWLELGGAGIFRPEVTIPLFGEHIPILAWGPGFDRILMNYYRIKDLRELYKNDIKQLREKKFWLK